MRGPAKLVAEAYTQYCAQASMGEASIASLGVCIPEADTAGEGVEFQRSTADQETRLDFFDNIAHSEGWTTGHARIRKVALARRDGRVDMSFAGGERVTLMVNAQAHAEMPSPIIGFFVKDRLGQSLFGHNTWNPVHPVPVRAGQSIEARFSFVLPMLPDGEYSMTVAIADGDLQDHVQHHWLHDAVILSVRSTRPRYGLVGIPFESIELHVQN
jgi:lipopolysaccharide transport system ATP-binding protein